VRLLAYDHHQEEGGAQASSPHTPVTKQPGEPRLSKQECEQIYCVLKTMAFEMLAQDVAEGELVKPATLDRYKELGGKETTMTEAELQVARANIAAEVKEAFAPLTHEQAWAAVNLDPKPPDNVPGTPAPARHQPTDQPGKPKKELRRKRKLSTLPQDRSEPAGQIHDTHKSSAVEQPGTTAGRNGDSPAAKAMENFPAPMAKEAFHGLAGKVCSILEEQNEACREALLAQFLLGFGNLVGKGPHKGEHFLNEFLCRGRSNRDGPQRHEHQKRFKSPKPSRPQLGVVRAVRHSDRPGTNFQPPRFAPSQKTS
jgi:hypothetical protein